MTSTPGAKDTSYRHIDPTVLGELRRQLAGRLEIIERIVASFLRTSPALLGDIRVAVEVGDPEAVRISAHTMKSSNAQVGATRLAAICQELEQLGTNKTLSGAYHLFGELQQNYQGVESELQRLLASWATR